MSWQKNLVLVFLVFVAVLGGYLALKWPDIKLKREQEALRKQFREQAEKENRARALEIERESKEIQKRIDAAKAFWDAEAERTEAALRKANKDYEAAREATKRAGDDLIRRMEKDIEDKYGRQRRQIEAAIEESKKRTKELEEKMGRDHSRPKR